MNFLAETIRTFIAIELPADILRQLESLQTGLKSYGLRLRWVRPQGIHLTLRFLGDILPPDVRTVEKAMAQAGRRNPTLSLAVQGMGVFPNIRRPKVLWTGLGGQTSGLERLHQHLAAALEDAGYKRERRPFKGHLTLARIKGTVDSKHLLDAIQDLGGFEPYIFEASEMVLFQSDLKPTGAVYTPLVKVALSSE